MDSVEFRRGVADADRRRLGIERGERAVEGQVMDGVAQGLGQPLMEERVYDSDGQILSGSLMD